MAKSPLIWFGGKGRLAARIVERLPPHLTYVEPFGGAGHVLFAKRPSAVEVYNDIDGALVNFFRVLRDPLKFRRLRRLCSLTPLAREEYVTCRAMRKGEGTADDVEWAWAFFVTVRQSISGSAKGWSRCVTESKGGVSASVSRYLAGVETLSQAHARLMQVQVESLDFRAILDAYDEPETCFYLDPPYVHSERGGHRYDHELIDEDHRDLVDRLVSLRGKTILSGYASRIYEPLEASGWQRVDIETSCYAVVRTRRSGLKGAGSISREFPRVESLWISPRARHVAQGKLC